MTRENLKSVGIGAAAVVAIFAGLIGLLTLVTGKSPAGDGAETVVYRSVDAVNLIMRIYKPPGWKAKDRRPCVAWFFGGGWDRGDVFQFAKQARTLADRGMVSVTVDYRVRSRHGTTPFDSVDDALAAMNWIRDHADELGIDRNRIAAGGGSSGGHLAAASAILPTNPDSPYQGDPVPAALVLFNPILDMEIPVIRERVGGDALKSLSEISPKAQLGSRLPPTLILHGTADTTVPIQTSEAFVVQANTRGIEHIELVAFPGKPHGFYHHGLNANRDFDETMRRVVAFLAGLGWIEN